MDTQDFLNLKELKTNDIENDNIGLGFFGETPIAQPQVEVNAGSMHAHLVTIGLIGSVA